VPVPGLNAFTMSPQKWIEATSTKGMISKSGRYVGILLMKNKIRFYFSSQILRMDIKSLCFVNEERIHSLKSQRTSDSKLITTH